MDEDFFEGLGDLDARSREVIEGARRQAVKLRLEVERKLKDLGDELERDYGLPRAVIDRELAKRRGQLLREFENGLRASINRLDKENRERVAPAVQRVIKAFREAAEEK